jgi:hypothetical protein
MSQDLAGPLSTLLIAMGVVLVGIGLWRARGPYLRSRELRAHLANLDRYETWRGNRPELPERGPDSGTLMVIELRRQVRLWLAVAGVGVLLVVLGFWMR